jgi:hypothetical protein
VERVQVVTRFRAVKLDVWAIYGTGSCVFMLGMTIVASGHEVDAKATQTGDSQNRFVVKQTAITSIGGGG